MTMVVNDRTPATRPDAEANGFPDTPEQMTGFIESIRIAGLRLAGYEAWAAGVCALVAIGCLAGATRLAIALIGPTLDVVVPMHCGSSIDCAMQTMGMLP